MIGSARSPPKGVLLLPRLRRLYELSLARTVEWAPLLTLVARGGCLGGRRSLNAVVGSEGDEQGGDCDQQSCEPD